MQKNVFVISLGGSVAVQEEINTSFLRDFSNFIKKETKKGKKFVIVIGGGRTARNYQKAALKASAEEKDWIGIKATELNSLLLRAFFVGLANPVIFNERFKIKSFGKYPVLIGCGWEPGWSTDYVAMRMAADFKIDKIINLGKADYVYNNDFEKNNKAKPLENLLWKDYLKIIPSKWTPGLNCPIDPVAGRFAQKQKIKAIVIRGHDLANLKRVLEGGEFKGTTII